jgi:hypothetical protein
MYMRLKNRLFRNEATPSRPRVGRDPKNTPMEIRHPGL